MDCVILAGNRESYRAISEKPNKAFLEVQGQSILKIMLTELEKVPEIDRLLLVGPKQQINQQLEMDFGGAYQKSVLVFEQGSDLVNNIEEVVEATQEGHDSDRYLLILPSDIPLMIAEEVSDFIAQCDMTQFDMVSGFTTSKALSRFYPTQTKPGVRMTYFFFKQGEFRINNMHMVRPAAMQRGHYIRKTYAMRYQKEWINIFKMVFQLVRVALRSPSGIFIYLGMTLSRWLNERDFKRMGRAVSGRFSLERTSKSISSVLGIRFNLVVTHLGGAAIDVDNDADYSAIQERFTEWTEQQREIAPKPEGND